ncbi:hypothetical protein GCM10022409_12770 [Hymenobacter glaciei]|uniref:Transporter-associated domain-containing protein n=1 Tax=Hymenobacter glaciei TaxID=877209 RepID=A0ABP7TRB0_9BACT
MKRFPTPAAKRRGLAGFHKIGGLVLHVLSAMPKSGERFTWQGHQLEIDDIDKSRIGNMVRN